MYDSAYLSSMEGPFLPAGKKKSQLKPGNVLLFTYMEMKNQYKPKNFHHKEPTPPQMIALTTAMMNPTLKISGRST